MHVTKRGAVIVQTDKTPPMGAKVVDKKAQPVGKVHDVFGPVKNPYVSVRVRDKENAKKLIGQPIYLYSR